MGSLLLFLLLGCALSLFSLASSARSLWSRIPLASLLVVVYILTLFGFGSLVAPAMIGAALLWGCGLLQVDCISLESLRRYLLPLGSAFFVVFFVALRPSLLEYPADHVFYWQRLVEVSGLGNSSAMGCDFGSPTAYVPYCTLWHKVSAPWPVSPSLLVSGSFVRLAHCGELLLLAIALLRLWACQRIRPVAAVCMLVLVFAGTGYLYDAFVINHALQGSILAAALLVESAGCFCWLFSGLRRAQNYPQAAMIIAAWYAVGALYLLLLIKIHGVFALLMLVWLLIVPVVLAFLPGYLWPLPKKMVIWPMSFIAAVLSLALFVVKDAINLKIAPNFAGVVIRWSDRLGFEGFGDWGPASFIPRTSDTRPEALAVLALLSSLAFFFASSAAALRTSSTTSGLRDRRSFLVDIIVRNAGHSGDYAILSSAYVIAILVAYVVPPFSNLFLKLNPDYSAHMRLMWGACLISPLPCLLFLECARARRLVRAASIAVLLVILLPIQFATRQRAQFFFSKVRHFLVPTPAWSDPGVVASLIVPQLQQVAGTQSELRNLRVAADPVIRSALYPFGIQGVPPLRLGADRLLQLSQPPRSLANSGVLAPPQLPPWRPNALPDLVIQQGLRDCFYSVYADMDSYSPCIAARATQVDLNRWSPSLLEALGYSLAWQSKDKLYLIWRRDGV